MGCFNLQAAALKIAERYVTAFGNIAKQVRKMSIELFVHGVFIYAQMINKVVCLLICVCFTLLQGNTILLPNDVTGVSSLITQAIAVYKRLGGDPANGSTGGKAIRPLEQSQQSTKQIGEKVDEVKVSKVTDEPGFSLQNRM